MESTAEKLRTELAEFKAISDKLNAGIGELLANLRDADPTDPETAELTSQTITLLFRSSLDLGEQHAALLAELERLKVGPDESAP